MSVLLRVKLRPSKKPDEEIKLLDTGMRDAMTAEMQYVQYFALRIVLDDVIERFDEITKNGRSAHARIE
jgi:predicted nucleotide-binding protein (sugar kinase/HSP70/actin superfamily)